jgi:spore germination cell wall hydrolase CwlJ-like protein
VFAPWALAFGLLVSVTARADQEPGTEDLTTSRFEASFPDKAKLTQASYDVGDAQDLAAQPDEIEPRYAPKRVSVASPVVDSAHKSDPFITLRPGFEARAAAAETEAEAETPAPKPVAISDDPPAAVTPSPAVAIPNLTVATAPAAPSFVPAKTDLSDRPAYTTLIAPKDRAHELRCLAEAVYFEARSEPEAGQAAVAQVVLNRVRSGIYPTTVCGVVYQDREHPFACQFSFACEGKALIVNEPGPWATATRIAEAVADGKTYDARFASAINYHALYVRPFWAATLKKLDRVGLHVFYAMRPGLYWAPGALNGRGDLPPLMAQAGPGPQTR